jgi:membrane associated rhomboid family serine protease
LLPLKDNIPTRTFPIVTVVLIVLNCLVYFGFEGGGFSDVSQQTRVVHYSAIPYELTHPGKLCGERARVGPTRQVVDAGRGGVLCEGTSESFRDTSTGATVKEPVVRVLDRNQPSSWLTILSAMFMHGSLLHLGGNMLFLWIFGNNIEDAMGRVKFVLFYLLGGLAAMLAQTAIDPGSTVPTLGASGAIAAVLGGYALLYPRARVVTLIFIIFFITLIEVPALLVLALWFGLQILDASSQTIGGGGGGVAYFAHIGGFVFGLAAVKLFASRYDPTYNRASRAPVH